MLNCNLSLDCTEIATNLWRVKELTTGGEEEQKCNTAAAQRMPRCFQNNYSGFVLMGQLLKLCKADRKCSNQRTLKKGSSFLWISLLRNSLCLTNDKA